MLIQHGKQFWQSLRYTAEVDPPHLVEFLMLVMAIAITGLAWIFALSWEFWVLGLSLGMGSAACCLIRETRMVAQPNPARQFLAFLMLVLSGYTIWNTLEPLL